MLARLEGIYLNILRVVILIAATLALAVAVLALAGAAPSLLNRVGVGSSSDLSGGDLAQFMSEQTSSTADESSDPQSRSDASPSEDADPLRASAERLAKYLNTHHQLGLTTAAVMEALQQSRDAVPVQYQAQYVESLNSLTLQLQSSTGSPLTADKVDEMLRWHHANFLARASEAETEGQLEGVAAITAIATAGGALLIFIFIVFCFLFVKIERNLRLIRVAGADEPLSASAE